MNKKDRNYIIAIGILILLFLFYGWRQQARENDLVRDIAKYSDTASFYKLKSGALVSTNQSLVLNSEKQLTAMAASINDTVKAMLKKFKKVEAVTYTTNNFYTGGDTIKTPGNIPCDFDPYKVTKWDKNYTLVQTIAKTYVSVDSLFIPNNQTLVFGRKKTGFLKHDYAVDVNNSNGLMTTTNIKDYRYKPQKMWYERTWVHMVAGAVIETGIRQGASYLIKR